MMDRRRIKRYNVIRRVRKRQEDMKANLMGLAQRNYMQAQGQLSEIEERQRSMIDRAQDLTTRTRDVRSLEQYLQFERHLGHLAIDKALEMRKLQDRVDERRADLQEATKRRRMIDRLIEQSQERLARELNKQEQHGLDEIASIRAAKQRSRRHDRSGVLP